MQNTFDSSELLRYENNAPGRSQAVYFGIDEATDEKIVEAFLAAKDRISNEKITDMGTALAMLRGGVSQAMGGLTLPQLLYVTHFIATHIAYMEGHNEGFVKGAQMGAQKAAEALTGFRGEGKPKPRKKGTGTSTSFNGPIGQA